MALVAEVAYGLYLGVLTGVFTALLVFALSFGFKYIAGVAFPAMLGLIIGLGAAGLQGGIRAFIRSPELLKMPTSIVAVIVILLVTLYAHKKGQQFGERLPPKAAVMTSIRRKTLSPEVVRQMGRFGQVRVQTTGEVADMEGYPPLSEDIRTAIREGEWTFPADLPVAELEKRLAEKLRTAHDLDDVAVSIDEHARATVVAAPPSSALSRRVPEGKRAVAVEALLPSGLARGDAVDVDLGETRLTGRVMSTEQPTPGAATTDEDETDAAEDEDAGESDDDHTPEYGVAGGEGRVALAVDAADATTAVEHDADQFAVRSRGQNREYELVSLLRGEGVGFRRVALHAGDQFVGRTLGEVRFREEHGVGVLAVKRADEWLFTPDGETELLADDELFVTGDRGALQQFQGVSA